MNNPPLISVVIPVFNSERFVIECVNSVLTRNTQDLEVIIVDDCSTDSSMKVLATLDDPRLRIVSFPENRGVSAARNFGLETARGKYVYFLDSDDWIDPDYLEAMLARAEARDLDVVVNSGVIEESSEGSLEKYPKMEEGWYPSEVVANKISGVVWMRLYKRKFLRDNELYFPEELSASEDYYFTKLAGMVAGRTWLFSGPSCHHRLRENSLSRANDFDNVRASKLLFDELAKRGIRRDNLKLFYARPVVIDTEQRFGFVKSFFKEIEPLVMVRRDLYKDIDLFCFDAVMKSGSFKEYSDLYGPSVLAAYVRNRFKMGSKDDGE